jgi:hypothetical protein
MEHTGTKIVNRREEMPAVIAMVEGFGIAHGTPAQTVNEINLALGEVLSIMISYGKRSGGCQRPEPSPCYL